MGGRAVRVLGLLVLATASVHAQDCLGLTRPYRMATIEATASFMRDGMMGPTTVGLGLSRPHWWLLAESGANLLSHTPAPTGDALAAALGLRQAFGLATVCAGAAASRESAGATPTETVPSGIAALSLALGRPSWTPVLFGVARYEAVKNDPTVPKSSRASGLTFRSGVSMYPIRWVGVRGFADLSGTTYKYGFSVSLVLPTGWESAPPRPRTVVDARSAEPASVPAVVAQPTARTANAATATVPAAAPSEMPAAPAPVAVAAAPASPSRARCVPDPRPGADKTCIPTGDDAAVDPAAGARPSSPDRDGDGVPDDVDACRNTPRGVEVDERGCARLFTRSNTFTLYGVTFETASATIRPSSFDRLDEVASALLNNPDVRIEIAGHTDNVGGADMNQWLSQARAESVRLYFLMRGVSANRMVARGYGLHRPLASNATPEGRAQNRRVDVTRLEW